MPRKPLRSQLNQVRAWVRQGRTDAWIAHQLDVPATELREFRRRHGLEADGEETGEVDLRDEIEAEIEAATLEEAESEEAEDEAEADSGDSSESERRRRRWRPAAEAAQASPRRPRWQASRRWAPGELRPRRGGRLRPLARSGGHRGPDLFRALDRAPQGRSHDRAGPDRDRAVQRRLRGQTPCSCWCRVTPGFRGQTPVSGSFVRPSRPRWGSGAGGSSDLRARVAHPSVLRRQGACASMLP